MHLLHLAWAEACPGYLASLCHYSIIGFMFSCLPLIKLLGVVCPSSVSFTLGIFPRPKILKNFTATV